MFYLRNVTNGLVYHIPVHPSNIHHACKAENERLCSVNWILTNIKLVFFSFSELNSSKYQTENKKFVNPFVLVTGGKLDMPGETSRITRVDGEQDMCECLQLGFSSVYSTTVGVTLALLHRDSKSREVKRHNIYNVQRYIPYRVRCRNKHCLDLIGWVRMETIISNWTLLTLLL